MNLIERDNFTRLEQYAKSIRHVHTRDLNEAEDAKFADLKVSVEKSITTITHRYPFFASFIYKLKIVYTDKVKTMATDGFRIFISYDWSSKLSLREVTFVLCHEILHNVFIHFYRRIAHKVPEDSYHLQIFNQAADYEINPVLIDDGILTKAEFDSLGGLYKEEFLNSNAEEIYDFLLDYYKQQKQKPKPQQSGSNGPKGPKGEKGESGDSGDSEGEGDEGEGDDSSTGSSGSGPGKGEPTVTDGDGKTWSPSTIDPKGLGNAPGDYGSKTGALDENLTPEEGDAIDPDGKKGRNIDAGDDDEGGEGGGGSGSGSGEGDGAPGGSGGKPVIDHTKDTTTDGARRQWEADRQLNAGKAKGSLYVKLKALSAPEMNWKKELKKFVGKNMTSKRDVMPARRHAASGRYLTGMVREAKDLDFVVAFVDTSGSMSTEDIEQCLSEFRGIIKDKKPKEAAIVYFDAGIQSIDWLKTSRKEPDLSKPQGGGGTAFKPCLKFLEQNFLKKGRTVDLVIFMTDGFNSDNGPMGVIDIPKPTYANKWVWVITDGNGAGASVKTRWGSRVNLPPSKKKK